MTVPRPGRWHLSEETLKIYSYRDNPARPDRALTANSLTDARKPPAKVALAGWLGLLFPRPYLAIE